jgi:hypothetical protein
MLFDTKGRNKQPRRVVSSVSHGSSLVSVLILLLIIVTVTKKLFSIYKVLL